MLVNNSEQLRELMDCAIGIKEKQGYDCLEIRNFRKESIFDHFDYLLRTYHMGHRIDTCSDIKTIQNKFDRTVRQCIRKAERSEMQIREGETKEDLKAFYDLYVKHRQQLHLPPHPYRFIQKLWEKLRPKGLIDLFGAVYQDRYVGAIFLTKFKRRMAAEYLVTEKEFLQYRPNNLLLWYTLKKMCHEGYKEFDFGRTHNANRGLLRFKKEWGSKEENLYQIVIPYRKLNNILNQNSPTVKELLNRFFEPLPPNMCRIFGNFIYNHVA